MILPSLMPGKLLIALVGRRRGEQFVAAAKAAGARGGTIAYGRTVADSKVLQALLLADVRQEIVLILMRDEAPAVIEGVREACRALPKKLNGIAVVLEAAASGAPGRLTNTTVTADPGGNVRSNAMESGYVLLTAIVNTGCADDVMAEARKAGARGGTILTARGTGTEEDVKFFGVTLVPEKEVLLIVAEKDGVEPVLAAIRAVPALREPGGGIVYAQNVEQFVVLGD
jgi:nitrogen regulatory protein PII